MKIVQPKREPSADLRQAAACAHECYTAMVDAGFTPEQAMTFVVQLLMAASDPR